MATAKTGRHRRCNVSWAPDGRMVGALWRDETIVADILSAPDRDAMMWEAAVRRTNWVVEVSVPSATTMVWLGAEEVRHQSFQMAFVRRVSTALRKELPRRRALVDDDDAPFPAVG